jgi:hypothetical protein
MGVTIAPNDSARLSSARKESASPIKLLDVLAALNSEAKKKGG